MTLPVPVGAHGFTVILQSFFFSAWATESITRDSTIRLLFGAERTSGRWFESSRPDMAWLAGMKCWRACFFGISTPASK
jgi:hypothetical protein